MLRLCGVPPNIACKGLWQVLKTVWQLATLPIAHLIITTVPSQALQAVIEQSITELSKISSTAGQFPVQKLYSWNYTDWLLQRTDSKTLTVPLLSERKSIRPAIPCRAMVLYISLNLLLMLSSKYPILLLVLKAKDHSLLRGLVA